MQKKILFLSFILFFVVEIIVSYLLIYPTINLDSGYYLSVEKEVYSGYIYKRNCFKLKFISNFIDWNSKFI